MEKRGLKIEREFIPENSSLIDILKIFSPGTPMRTALDDILSSRMGALIVIDKDGLSAIAEGGFKINCPFSPQKLTELAKMDGAIILSRDLKKILYSNVLLVPKSEIKTKETGTRHKAAEKTSKQIKTIVIAVSERKNKITLYWGEEKYVLEKSSEILRRATESLQILEKQKEVFDDLLSHLNILEITDLVTMRDVCNVLQRIEIIKRISEMIKRYLIELGKEGVIVSMRLKELIRNLDKERVMIIKDYFGDESLKAEEILTGMNFDFLLETSNISRLLFEELHDKPVSPRGYRILEKTGILEKDITILVNNFNTLNKIFCADEDSLVRLFRNENFVVSLKQDLDDLKEKVLSRKRI
ncbi:MAG: DNA integrity scanning diadenylate cyclase DisA [Nanoarchaeota archaeon]